MIVSYDEQHSVVLKCLNLVLSHCPSPSPDPIDEIGVVDDCLVTSFFPKCC